MTYKEKDNIITLIVTLITTLPYGVFIANKYNSEPMDANSELRFWGSVILILIPIRIATQIIAMIIFSILEAIISGGKPSKMITDERDENIEQKSLLLTTYLFIFGFLIAMVFAASGSLTSMFIVMFAAGFLSELAGIFARIYLYHRGS